MLTAPRVAVGAIIESGDALLLIQRGKPPGAGQWSVPGGIVEAGETLRAALVREVLEETGIVVEVGAFAGWVERIRDGFHFVILDFFATPHGEHRDLSPGDDAADARWVPIAEIHYVDLVEGLLDFLREIGSVAP
jgi:ADP-ribose pyrophosphatase YjhB (NUDIX family)